MIERAQDGVLIAVRVIPRAARSEITGTRGDAFLVRLNAPPVDGAANAELIRLLAAMLEVPKRAITIVAGEHSRNKRVRVAGLDVKAAEARLQG
jgi:uncharacterized protein (TIGR00251 family)